MAINLVKGQRVEIGLSKLIVEMGWKVNPNAKPPYDLDASTFLLRANGEITWRTFLPIDARSKDNLVNEGVCLGKVNFDFLVALSIKKNR